jgi:peptidoglycan/xylan/chitin deacetylase (PgdA/CDA1 family)
MTALRLEATATVLMYHSVCVAPARPGFAPYVVTPRVLESHLSALAGAGLAVDSTVPPAGTREVTPRVVLTFDDGYRDFYDTVLPMLERHRMRASLFVPTGYLGGTAGWLAPEGEGNRPIIDAAQLRDIAASGLVDIGAHSHSHPALDRVDVARRRSEIHLPRLILEDLLQMPVRTFAYPFGYFNGGTRREVTDAGYDLAYAVGERHATPRDHPLAIPRWGVGPVLAPSELVRLVRSVDGVRATASTAAKRHVWRQIRRVRRQPAVPPAGLPAIPACPDAVVGEAP